ncbi:MAG TPA: DUF5985 family protein [Longimicrobiaceae bacterium]|nr:DUF5985 family protein [Longimicrobiaceae bacterium]
MRELLSGAIVMGYLLPGVFFFRFWKDTADRLFLIFGLAFTLLAVQRTMLTLLADTPSAHIYLYVIRLLAFLLIIAAIVDKNRAAGSRR